jgi:hypothetical protein
VPLAPPLRPLRRRFGSRGRQGPLISEGPCPRYARRSLLRRPGSEIGFSQKDLEPRQSGFLSEYAATGRRTPPASAASIQYFRPRGMMTYLVIPEYDTRGRRFNHQRSQEYIQIETLDAAWRGGCRSLSRACSKTATTNDPAGELSWRPRCAGSSSRSLRATNRTRRLPGAGLSSSCGAVGLLCAPPNVDMLTNSAAWGQHPGRPFASRIQRRCGGVSWCCGARPHCAAYA